jgi:hypothetical protein
MRIVVWFAFAVIWIFAIVSVLTGVILVVFTVPHPFGSQTILKDFLVITFGGNDEDWDVNGRLFLLSAVMLIGGPVVALWIAFGINRNLPARDRRR